MTQIQNFFNSLTVEQWALAFGALAFLVHTLLDAKWAFSKPLNLFLVRATSVVIPVATVLALDPSVSSLVSGYFPALLGYFTAYQGLYHFVKAVAEKWASLKTLATVARVGATPQV